MTHKQAWTWVVLPAALLVVSGCSATKFGKCKDCGVSSVYPAEPCYECMQGGTSAPMSSPQMQPAPLPTLAPIPAPPGVDSTIAPPPPPAPAEARIHAQPLQRISASTRNMYDSMNNNIRAMFSR
ncbi:hypothetical protein GC163_01300 [bacterium]|nr:hypothetical protein [bacterium]